MSSPVTKLYANRLRLAQRFGPGRAWWIAVAVCVVAYSCAGALLGLAYELRFPWDRETAHTFVDRGKGSAFPFVGLACLAIAAAQAWLMRGLLSRRRVWIWLFSTSVLGTIAAGSLVFDWIRLRDTQILALLALVGVGQVVVMIDAVRARWYWLPGELVARLLGLSIALWISSLFEHSDDRVLSWLVAGCGAGLVIGAVTATMLLILDSIQAASAEPLDLECDESRGKFFFRWLGACSGGEAAGFVVLVLCAGLFVDRPFGPAFAALLSAGLSLGLYSSFAQAWALEGHRHSPGFVRWVGATTIARASPFFVLGVWFAGGANPPGVLVSVPLILGLLAPGLVQSQLWPNGTVARWHWSCADAVGRVLGALVYVVVLATWVGNSPYNPLTGFVLPMLVAAALSGAILAASTGFVLLPSQGPPWERQPAESE